MNPLFLGMKIAAVITFAGAGLYIHFRGKVRLRALRQITDHSMILAPYNLFIYATSAVPNKPYLKPEAFPELAILRENWQVISEEALALYQRGGIGVTEDHDDLAFQSFFKRGWKRFYFKWYGGFLPSAQENCPRTVEILKQVPSMNAAMLTVLTPGCYLGPHRDPFAGSVRYHLGLSTPNSSDCKIFVDGEPYTWRDGQDVLFDETFVHTAHNQTDMPRIILFCDIERPLRFAWARWINKNFTRVMGRMTATKNVPGEHVGLLNKLFKGYYFLREQGQRLKRFNKPLYKTIKVIVAIGILYLLFGSAIKL